MFDHIANSLAEFMEENEMDMSEQYTAVFIFGFPVKQENLVSGKLKKWTKGYQVHDVVDRDAKELLESAISKKGGMDIDIVAFVNNSTALLYGGARKDKKCKIGLILGYGINASYIEKIEKVLGSHE